MCSICEWKEILEEIDEMLSDSDFDFANDTLAGIAEWVKGREHITEKQIAAIDNIKNAVEDRR